MTLRLGGCRTDADTQSTAESLRRADGHAVADGIDVDPIKPGAVARILTGLNLECGDHRRLVKQEVCQPEQGAVKRA